MKRLHNKLTHRLLTLITSAALLAGALPWGATGRIVQADAFTTAPQGIKLDNLFVPGTFSENSAKILSGKTTVPNTDVVQITDAKKQKGAVWSTAINKFDLTKDQTATMWLNFGTQAAPADGMALVLQNDARGTGAISSSNQGQSLGVYGEDKNDGSQKTTKDSAIQHSWALEFDSYVNNANNPVYSLVGLKFDKGSSFDYYKDRISKPNIKTPHIAYNWPAQGPSSHTPETLTYTTIWPGSSSIDIMTQTHFSVLNNITSTMFSSGNWYHLTLDWNAGTKKMTYTFNDKNPTDGSPRTGEKATTTEFPLDEVFGKDIRAVTWGFTGSTGPNNFQNSMVIFESIPNLVEGNAAVTIRNLTQQSAVITGSRVTPGDRLEYTFTLNRTGGNQDWADIIGSLKLPDDEIVDLIADAGKIVYADPNLPDQVLKEVETVDDLYKIELDHPLTADNPWAKIVLAGPAINATTKAITVASQTSQFAGSYLVTNATSPQFTILDNKPLVVTRQEVTNQNDPIAIKQGAATPVPKFVTHYNDAAGKPMVATNSNFTVTATLTNNNNASDTQQLTSTWTNGSAAQDGLFTLAFPDKFSDNTGNYTLKVKVTDKTGHTAMSEDILVQVTGILELLVEKNSSFTQSQLTGATMLIGRNDDWGVTVHDTRGTGSGWQLSAAASPLTPVSKTVNTTAGSLVFSRDGTSEELLPTDPNQPMPIAAKKASTNLVKEETTNITDAWTEATGIKARISSSAVGGSYQSVITWTLTDGPS
ncbi:WxL domain-containing protein [Lapidilactobacillus achengensis]|uniref:WxL domain-containing protein n=1 Tax=Lapidilactobacillus achengensis TaxID=2486000 RepID=A0ABW1UP08_9LACO|nr:WxL domain-containing protein [Lapidilactobacillus achengensis]